MEGFFFKKLCLQILGCIALLFSLGCSSWSLKAKCSATNWFEYSQKLAFEGKYLEEDPLVKDCKGLDRTSATQLDLGFKLGREKMCTYDEIHSRAVNGQPVFFKFCDGLEMNLMKRRHQDGLVIFCTSERGYPYGRSGQVYLKVCNPKQETQFLPSYFKGRKEFLSQTLADSKEQEIAQSATVQSLASAEEHASRAYNSIPHVLECRTINVFNQSLKKDESKNICSEPHYIQSQRDSLGSVLSSASAATRKARGILDETRTKIQWAQQELAIIPEIAIPAAGPTL